MVRAIKTIKEPKKRIKEFANEGYLVLTFKFKNPEKIMFFTFSEIAIFSTGTDQKGVLVENKSQLYKREFTEAVKRAIEQMKQTGEKPRFISPPIEIDLEETFQICKEIIEKEPAEFPKEIRTIVQLFDYDDLIEGLREKDPDIEFFLKLKTVLQVIFHKKIRYRVPADVFKAIKHNEQLPETINIDGLIGEKPSSISIERLPKRRLGLIDYVALFDVILRLARIERKKYVIVTNMDIESKEAIVITPSRLREMLQTDSKTAYRIKNAINKLVTTIIYFKDRKERAWGIRPLIVPHGFTAYREGNKEMHYYEINSFLLSSAKEFIPMVPNAYTSIMKLPLASREKEFITKVYTYLIMHKNKDGEVYISPKSFGREFPNAYSRQRKMKQLHQRIHEALEHLQEADLVHEYKPTKNGFRVRVR